MARIFSSYYSVSLSLSVSKKVSTVQNSGSFGSRGPRGGGGGVVAVRSAEKGPSNTIHTYTSTYYTDYNTRIFVCMYMCM